MNKLIACCLLLLLAWATPALAQSPDAQKLYTKLYCPLCGGVRLDACQLTVCVEMKAEIEQKLAAGQSEQQIIAYYRERWGDQVLGYPPAEGIGWLPWLAPLALVIGGGLVLWRVAASWTRARPAARAATLPDATVSSEIAERIERELDQ